MPPSNPQLLARSGTNSTFTSPLAEVTKTKIKSGPTGDKILVRRLPPSLTLTEFQSILGPVWHPGNGKVGWLAYEKGKISKDPSKPARPSRAYLLVLRKDDLFALSEAVRTATWEDTASSYSHPGYTGPPVAEFAIYKKTPNPGKRKEDVRAGTIDQDPEFMNFLEKLANPQSRQDDLSDKVEGSPLPSAVLEVTTTPLIEAIREKKAAKAREAASAKLAKQTQAATAKEKRKAREKENQKEKDKKTGKSKETVKILTKKAAQEAAVGAAKAIASQITSQPQTQMEKSSQPAALQSTQPTQKSRRAGIAAAARILQRDLGISPGSAHRRARLDAQKAEAEAKVAGVTAGLPKDTIPRSPKAELTANKQPSRPSTPTAPKSLQQQQQQILQSVGKKKGKQHQLAASVHETGKGKKADAVTTPAQTPQNPVMLLRKDKNNGNVSQPAQSHTAPTTKIIPPAGPAAMVATVTASAPPPAAPTGPKGATSKIAKGNANKSNQKKQTTQITTGVTRAFVKHANPSQGITEPLLKTALEAFGAVTFVEIDRRKGFAYADFTDHDGLTKAIAASPISVAQGTVQVLERRDKSSAQKAGQPTTVATVTPADKSTKIERGQNLNGGDKGLVLDALKKGGKASDIQASAEKAKSSSVGSGKSDAGGAAPKVEAGSVAGGGKTKVRRGGRGRGTRGKEGNGGNSNNSHPIRQQSQGSQNQAQQQQQTYP